MQFVELTKNAVQSGDADVVDAFDLISMMSAVTAASSATGRSLVPAQMTAIVPGRLGKDFPGSVMQRARE